MTIEPGSGGWRPAGGKPLGYALKVWALYAAAESDRRPSRTGGSPVPAGRVPTIGEQDPGEEPRWGERPLRDHRATRTVDVEVGSGGELRDLPRVEGRWPTLDDRAEVVFEALEEGRVDEERALRMLEECPIEGETRLEARRTR